jgi:hypothetical protein
MARGGAENAEGVRSAHQNRRMGAEGLAAPDREELGALRVSAPSLIEGLMSSTAIPKNRTYVTVVLMLAKLCPFP